MLLFYLFLLPDYLVNAQQRELLNRKIMMTDHAKRNERELCAPFLVNEANGREGERVRRYRYRNENPTCAVGLFSLCICTGANCRRRPKFPYGRGQLVSNLAVGST